MKQFLNRYGAYLAAAVIFILLAVVYCKPVLSGKVINAGDNINGTCAVQEALAFDEEANGEYGFWNGSMFSGMPNYQIGGGHYKSSDLLRPFDSLLHQGHNKTIWVFIIYFFCFFLVLRSFGVDNWLCIAGAIAMALSSYFIVIIAAGHNGKTSTIALISVVAAGFYLIFRKKYGLGAILVMLFTAVGFSTHPQMAYYIFMMIGLFYCAEIWIHAKEKRWKDLGIGTAIFAVALLIGLGTGSANIFANKEYAEQTMRGGHSDLVSEGESQETSKGLDIEYATQWSYGKDETFSFLIPGFMGGSSSYPIGTDSHLYKSLVRNRIPAGSARSFCNAAPIYWGEQPFTAGNVYMGAIICFLFLLGCLIVKGPYKWALVVATIFSTMLAWGHNCLWLTELFFKYFPLYNKFRAVSSILIVAEIAMPLLGMLAVKEMMDGNCEKKKLRKSIFISGGITAGLCLVFALFGGAMFDFKSSYDAGFVNQIPDFAYTAILEDRAALLRSDSFRSFIFIVLAAALLLLYNKGKVKNGLLAAILGVLILVDMWPVDKRYLNDDNFVTPRQHENAYAMQPYEAALLQDPDPHFRVMNLTTNTFNDARTSYYLKSIGGYSAAKLRRYQDLIDEHLSNLELPVIGMLNAKYIITQGEDGQPVPQLNPYALGNAWFVGQLVEAENANDESALLSTVDLTDTAVYDKSFSDFVTNRNPGVAPDASVELTKYLPRALDYSCTSSTPGTIVFSEIYYPYGWKASIDGKPTDHFRVNYTLRALNVPAGTHKIHFEFDPDSVRKGDAIATVCTLLMYAISLAIIAFAIVRTRKEKKANA